MNQKLWLVGMVKGNRNVLKNSISHVLPYFDGLIFVVDDRAKPEDIDWLNSIKKEGKIVVKKWVNDHAHTSNEIIFSGVMDFPDFFTIIDETDRLNEVFVKDLREKIKYWHQNNVGMVFLDHPFVLRYHDGLRFAFSPHWNCVNILGKIVNLASIPGYRKENYVFNTRDTLKSGFLSPIKYYFQYPAFSNHTQLLYAQFGNEVWQRHESIRINFRFYCKQQLGIDLTLDSLIKYLQENVGKYPEYFEQVLELEVNLKDAFRLFVLKQPWQDVAKLRFDWSYFHWKNTREIIQDPKKTGYIGAFNQYKLTKGEKSE